MKKPLLTLIFGILLFCANGQQTDDNATVEERLDKLESKTTILDKLKFSGLVQAQWVWDESGIADDEQNKFTIRRGRFRAEYAEKFGSAVLQLEITESGVKIHEGYINLKAAEYASLTAGVFARPFGHEATVKAALRETPEVSRIYRTLFVGEAEIGAMVNLKAPTGSFVDGLALRAAIVNGNGGRAEETDSRKDFTGRLSYSKGFGCFGFGAGVSYYYGNKKLAQGAWEYRFRNKRYELNTADIKYSKREYFSADLQLHLSSVIGKTTLRGEYFTGIQPGGLDNSTSGTEPLEEIVLSRKFSGYYIYFIQDIARTKHSFIARYDNYDPSRKLGKSEIQTYGDIAYNTYGLGWMFRANRHVWLSAFYEFVRNEKTNGYLFPEILRTDFPDDIFTLRLQYAF